MTCRAPGGDESMDKKAVLWTPRPYRSGDEHALMDLTKLVLERDLALKDWRWLFSDNPAGEGFFSLADHDGNIVGQYVVIPIRMLVGGEEITGAQSMDTMTHPDYRRQGMFTTLANEVYAELKRCGIHAAYGFPNPASHPGFVNKLEWITLIDLPFRARPLKPGTILAEKFGAGSIMKFAGAPTGAVFNRMYPVRAQSGDPELRKIDSFGPEFDDLWTSVAGSFNCVVKRDAAYLNWRYIAKPGADYSIFGAYDTTGRLAGYSVLKTIIQGEVRQGHLLDVLAVNHDGKTASALIRAATRRFNEQDCDVAICLMLEHAPYYNLLRRHGFIFQPKTLPYIVRRNTEKYPWSLLENPTNWHITFGDSDFV